MMPILSSLSLENWYGSVLPDRVDRCPAATGPDSRGSSSPVGGEKCPSRWRWSSHIYLNSPELGLLRPLFDTTAGIRNRLELPLTHLSRVESEAMMKSKLRSQSHRPPRLGIFPVSSLLSLTVLWGTALDRAIAQTETELCPAPALERLTSHAVQSGETVDSIAAAYDLLPITLLALNPAIANGGLATGTTLSIPPFNGAAVSVSPGQTWQDLATIYGARADVLFEINGCPDGIPSRVFIPGVSWLLEGASAGGGAAAATDPLSTFPLVNPGTIVANYGWQTDRDRNELVFSSGVTLETALDTAVVAAGEGTVAYVGDEATLGTLIVINHDQGFQTRYARLTMPTVRVGDVVSAGQTIAQTLPNTEDSSVLYFEVRTNSALGWVARDPGDYIPDLALR